jgi:hypothetical protein
MGVKEPTDSMKEQENVRMNEASSAMKGYRISAISHLFPSYHTPPPTPPTWIIALPGDTRRLIWIPISERIVLTGG